MSALAAAGRKLIGQQTLSKPSSSFDQAVDRLEAFNAANVGTPKGQLPQKVALDTQLQDAALAFFAYRFTAVSPQAADPGRSLKLAADVAQGVLGFADAAHQRAFLDEVVFNVSHPAGHQALAPLVRKALPAAEVERAVLGHARSSNALHVHNALQAAQWVFGPSYALSDTGRQQLQQRVDALKQLPGLNPLLAQTVASFTMPAGPPAPSSVHQADLVEAD